MFGGIDQHDVMLLIYNTCFEFIVLKHLQIYHKYLYTELQYHRHGIEKFVMVSKNDIAVLLNFGIFCRALET